MLKSAMKASDEYARRIKWTYVSTTHKHIKHFIWILNATINAINNKLILAKNIVVALNHILELSMYLIIIFLICATSYKVYYNGAEKVFERIWYGRDGSMCGEFSHDQPVLRGANK